MWQQGGKKKKKKTPHATKNVIKNGNLILKKCNKHAE
jgi:hypothetical protein